MSSVSLSAGIHSATKIGARVSLRPFQGSSGKPVRYSGNPVRYEETRAGHQAGAYGGQFTACGLQRRKRQVDIPALGDQGAAGAL